GGKATCKSVFAGTAPFAVPSLRALRRAGHEILLVITQPDRPGNRMRVKPPAIKLASIEPALPVYQPERIRDPESVERLRELAPDFLVVVAYGQILPRSVLAIPRLGAINVHASLLPRHRGAAPVARAILAGDHETGVTIMKMDEQLDNGAILGVRGTAMGEGGDGAAMSARLGEVWSGMLMDDVVRYVDT